MRAVFAALPLAVVALDFEGRVTLWSNAAQALFGWNEEEAVGRVAASDMCALARDAVGGATVLDVRLSPMRSDGERIDVTASIVPLRDGDSVMGAVAVFTRV
jgi:PAS domain S-box-containing protein